MAKPPIIIANGRIAEELTKGLKPAAGEKGEPWEIILRNVDRINKRVKTKGSGPQPVAMSLDYPAVARIYWRLEDENEHPDESGAGAR
jgi:hypothetical protein